MNFDDPKASQQNTGRRQPFSPQRDISAKGKFLFLGDEKFWVKGVTYGTFRPDKNGDLFPAPTQVSVDFRKIKEAGFNCVRTYTAPPVWLLDLASENGLKILLGLAWEQHIAFLDDAATTDRIRSSVRNQVNACAGHEAILAYAIGNEIPASIIRWSGRRKVERFLKSLFDLTKNIDPNIPVTYVNFPTTEFLELPFLDIFAFNVYLEEKEEFDAYLKRLQTLAGDKPMILAEIGLDSRRNSEEAQAASITWQIGSVFEAGGSGAFVFSWTDEWYRGGQDIDDWDFGLTDRNREPKLALKAAVDAVSHLPFPESENWPKISIVVCSYNGEPTITDTLEGVTKLNYPNYEIIVIDDGSTDRTAQIAQQYDVILLSTENQGLSAARNEGLKLATGEIVAYTDDDAYPDPDWLNYLAKAFELSDHAAIGGPNLAPAEDKWIGQCVANSPGGPLHVLLTDEIAEHIPGCNMAFRRERLLAIGGFDPRYRAAGDDVDVCWRLQDKGWTIGFSPSALVWHHRRNSIEAYWRQQVGYGKAESLLEQKWPNRFNELGHISWAGRIYGNGIPRGLRIARPRVYAGVWGTAAYQSLYQPNLSIPASLLLTPEWWLAIVGVTIIALGGMLWSPLLWAAPLAGLMVVPPILQAMLGAAAANYSDKPRGQSEKIKRFWLTTVFHLGQPLARLWGRIKHGLTLWRQPGDYSFLLPRIQSRSFWFEAWTPYEKHFEDLEAHLHRQHASVWRGHETDQWDLEVRTGPIIAQRILLAFEEHGSGRQNVRCRTWPTLTKSGFLIFVLLVAAFIFLASQGYWLSAGIAAMGIGLGSLALLNNWSRCHSATESALDAFAPIYNSSKA
jgi:GT2 family glycosyltransferase/membrane protein implicated in regulation of membrane protease activity